MFSFGSKLENVTTTEITDYLNEGATLIDIRSSDAFKEGHINGAVNIPIKLLPFKLNELDKAKTLLIICYVGGSSVAACKFLQKSGFTVKNILGGMQDWNGSLISA